MFEFCILPTGQHPVSDDHHPVVWVPGRRQPEPGRRLLLVERNPPNQVPTKLNTAKFANFKSIELPPSFFTGVWGLFVLFGITNSNGLLVQHMFVKKALVLKIPMVLINIQVATPDLG